jgi:uncharacterized membrane protein YeaQ/YmgE (transglycosylase-associated protein family)
MKGSKFSLLENIVIGVIGSTIGGSIFGFLGISAGELIGSIVIATVGAILLLDLSKNNIEKSYKQRIIKYIYNSLFITSGLL